MEHNSKAPYSTSIQVITMPNKILRFASIFAWISRLIAASLTHRFDVIQIESFSLPRSLVLFILLRPISRRSVIVFHDKCFEQDPRNSIAGRLNLALQRTLIILFDASITPGLSIKEWFKELHGAAANKIVVIPNGAPSLEIRSNNSPSHMRKKYNIDCNTFVALFFGSMTFKPNHDTALYLYRISDPTAKKFEQKTQKKLVFIVAGAGSETLPKTEHFVPLGFVDELSELLSLPDAIVLPHSPSYSGPHVKTMYALLSGRPLIASEDAVKDMPHLTSGEHFLPLDIKKPDALLESLMKLIQCKELGTRLALNAYLYSKKSSWKNIAIMHLNLYEKLAK
jgi:glycosyltransferase involved in cell wall biosynthesis